MIVTMASFKGGVAKSTTAIHIAFELARTAKTLLVDGDPNRSSSRWTARGHSMPFLICDESEGVRYAQSGNFEHIVIDTKARPEPSDLRALAKGCDLLVLPCTPDDLSIDAMLGTVAAIKSAGAVAFRVLLTIVPPRPDLDGKKAREALTAAGIPLFNSQIPRAAAYRRCMVTGQVVRSPEYGDVADEIVTLVEELKTQRSAPVVVQPHARSTDRFLNRPLAHSNARAV